MPPSTPSDRRSILPLLVTAVACLAALAPLIVHHARTVEVEASMDVFFAADTRARGSFEKLETMMTERIACLVLVRLDDLFSEQGAALVHELGEALMALEGVPRVYNLTRAERPVRAPGFSLDLDKLVGFETYLPLAPRTEEEWRRIEALVTDYPWARDLLVSRDGRWTMLVAEVERDLSTHATRARLRADVEAVVAPFRAQVAELHLGSFPFIEAEMRDDIQRDVRRFLYVLPVLLIAILLITFRSLQVLACVVVFEAAGVGLLPVLFNWNGSTINLYTGIVFPLIAGLQLTFLTHLFAALNWARHKDFPLPVALAVALRHVLRPSAMAAITTIIGLLSLLACDVGLVRDFGALGAQAVLACFIVTFLPTWLLSRFLSRGTPPPDDAALRATDQVDVWMGRLDPLVTVIERHRRVVLAVAAVFVLAALPGLSGVRTDLRAIEFLNAQGASRQALSAVDTHMGGMNLFELEIDCGREGGIHEPESLAFLERLEQHAAGIEGVTNVYGYAQIFAMLNEIWHRDAPGSRRVPQSPLAIAAMAGIVHGEDFLFEESFYDADRRRTTLFVRTRDMPAVRYLEVLERVVAFAEENRPDHVTISGKAGLHSVLESDRRIVASQVRTLLLCVVAIFVTLSVLWRSPRLALVLLAANVPPLAAVLALHGYAGIPLNSVTVMVGAVILGIAVDSGIHVVSFWSEERGQFEDPRDGLRWVLAHKLGPITCTTAVLVSGLSLFLLSRFPPLADFGTLSILALLIALASTAVVLPSLLLGLFGRSAAPSTGDSPPDGSSPDRSNRRPTPA